MAAIRKSIIAAALALLLAIAAAINPAGCNLDETDYTYSFKSYEHVVTVWGPKPECTESEFMLPDVDDCCSEAGAMKAWLNILSEEQPYSKTGEPTTNHVSYARRLLLYAKPNKDACEGIFWLDYLRLVSKCNDEKKFEHYANFMNHFAPGKFHLCARQIIRNLGQYPKSVLAATNRFFRTGLGVKCKTFLFISRSLSDQEMYDKVKEVDLTTTKFNVAAMIKVAKRRWRSRHYFWHAFPNEEHELLASELSRTLDSVRSNFYPEVNIVNVARGLGIIGEGELTPKFLLANKYVGLSFQIDNPWHFSAMKSHFHFCNLKV